MSGARGMGSVAQYWAEALPASRARAKKEASQRRMTTPCRCGVLACPWQGRTRAYPTRKRGARRGRKEPGKPGGRGGSVEGKGERDPPGRPLGGLPGGKRLAVGGRSRRGEGGSHHAPGPGSRRCVRGEG